MLRHLFARVLERRAGERPTAGSGGALEVAMVTTFYPNSADPARAVFVENLALELRRHCRVRVVSPVPVAPPTARWAAWRAIARVVRRKRIGVVHPRFVVVPRVEWLTGCSYGLGVLGVLARLARRHPGLVLHAHCAYPDAVGTAIAARLLGLPYMVTMHGSDLNVYSYRGSLRPQIRWALRHAAQLIAVSPGLQRRALELAGAEAAARCHQIPCAAVNPAVFNTISERFARRAGLGLPAQARVVVFIGTLRPVKGVDTLLAAWLSLAGRRIVKDGDLLAVIGVGPLEARLRAQAAGCAADVRFVGALPQPEVAAWLRAADLMCLPSRSEGTPNVVIEALASGTPVVASAVGSVPQFVHDAQTGFLVQPDDVAGLAEALARGLSQAWDERALVDRVGGFTWSHIAAANFEVLVAAAGGAR